MRTIFRSLVVGLSLMVLVLPMASPASAATEVWRYAKGKHGTWYYMQLRHLSYRQDVTADATYVNAWSTNGYTNASARGGVVQAYSEASYKSGCGWSLRAEADELIKTRCVIHYST